MGENLNDIKALVVDDNMANAVVLSTLLERYGIQSDTAESGMEAIERVCSKEYDIIMMDYLMPDMDGLEATKQIVFVSEDRKKPVIIGVSATVDTQVIGLFDEAGADCVLKKPVSSDDLEHKLVEYGFMSEDAKIQDNSDDNEDATAFLSAIDGLNYAEGISLMAGSLENYMKVLGVSVRNIYENYNKIDIIRNTEQMDTHSLHFHSLKGIFLNIGADDLANDSKMMEFAAKESENEYVHQQMDQYMQDIYKFYEQLEKVCVEYKERTAAKKAGVSMGDSEFIQSLDSLKESIDNFEYIEITETLETMLNSSEGIRAEKLQSIYDSIQNFEYDEAMEILNELYSL